MNTKKTLERLAARLPIEEIPLTWDDTGYTSEAFNRWASDPAFAGWSGDLPAEDEVRVMVELLGARPGESLLDVACGYGRHALLLALSHSLRVTGIDISPGLIATARRRASERGLEIGYEARQARDLSWSNEFDHAVIVFNSFSLFSPEDAPAVLQGIHRALRPAGHLFLDLDNKPYNIRYGTSARNWRLGPDGLTLQEVHFHVDESVEVMRDLTLGTDDEQAQEFIVFQRLYSRNEIEELVSECGFRLDKVYGGWDLSALSEGSSKILLVGEKV